MTEKYMPDMPIDMIEESPTNPRKWFEPVKLQELADSIKEHGLIQPVLVRPLAAFRGRVGFELVAGARRFRASKLAEVPTIKATVRELTDTQVLELQLLENNQREDVTPLEEADAMRHALDGGVYGEPGAKSSVEALGRAIGKSSRYVYDRLALSKLTDEARKELESGNISVGHAALLVRLTPEGQTACLTEMLWDCEDRLEHLGETEMPVRDLAEYIAHALTRDLSKAPFDPHSVDLLPSAGPCNGCPKRDVTTESDAFGKCLDRACYENKREAETERKAAEAASAHPDAIQISAKYSSQRPGVTGTQGYTLVPEGTDGAVKAVVVEAWRDEGLGEVAWIRPTSTEEERQLQAEARKAEEERKAHLAKIETEYRKRLFDGILSLRTGRMPIDLMRLAVYKVYAGSYSKMQDPAKRALGLKPKASYDEARVKIENASEGVLCEVLLILCLWNERSVDAYNVERDTPKAMLAMASAFGVDVHHIRREAEEKFAQSVRTSAPVVVWKPKLEIGAVVVTSYQSGPYEILEVSKGQNGHTFSLSLVGWGSGKRKADSWINGILPEPDKAGGWKTVAGDRVYVVDARGHEAFAGLRSMSKYARQGAAFISEEVTEVTVGGEKRKLVALLELPIDPAPAPRRFLFLVASEGEHYVEILDVRYEDGGNRRLDQFDREVRPVVGEQVGEQLSFEVPV